MESRSCWTTRVADRAIYSQPTSPRSRSRSASRLEVTKSTRKPSALTVPISQNRTPGPLARQSANESLHPARVCRSRNPGTEPRGKITPVRRRPRQQHSGLFLCTTWLYRTSRSHIPAPYPTQRPVFGRVRYFAGFPDRAFAASALFSAHRFFVAAMIARLPAAESFRLGLAAASGVEVFLDAAHLLRCASAMRARAAALIFRRSRIGDSDAAVGSGRPPSSIPRSSAILTSMCRFCSSNPRMAAVMISGVSFVGISVCCDGPRLTHLASATTGRGSPLRARHAGDHYAPVFGTACDALKSAVPVRGFRPK